ncbi:glycosyltransferase family 1 protein [Nocardioides sp. HDW12B]|nr:glycosyltransferase family 1 protein [Nocardioides sp. HDW12B]
MNLYRKLDRSLVQFDFLVFDEEIGTFESEVNELGGKVIRIGPLRGRGYRESCRAIAQEIRSHGPYQVVHSHLNLASAAVVQGAWGENVPVRVAHSHTTRDGDQLGGQRSKQAFARLLIRRFANRYVACGEDAGRHLFGNAWKRGSVLPNAVDLERFVHQDVTDAITLRTAHGVPADALLVGSVARLGSAKNLDFVIDLAEQVVRTSEVYFWIVGDGPDRERLESRVHRSDLTDRVQFLGMRTDIPAVLLALDALLMPSLYEGLPVSVIEAQAAGTLSLVSDRVTREVDLGLGLVEYLSLERPDIWQDSILRLKAGGTKTDTRELLSESDYNAANAVELVLRLYGLEA